MNQFFVSRARIKEIYLLAIPIVAGMVSQNIFNLVDTAMVGSLGNSSLAAVGIAGFAAFMCNAITMGLSAGVQSITARRIGEGQKTNLASALNAGLITSVVIGSIMGTGLYFLAPYFFPLLNPDPEVVAEGIPYLQARVIGITAIGINMSFRGFWNALKLSKFYMRSIIVMHICNVIFNYLLIFGKFGFPELGVAGAGIGTMLATFICTGVYIFLGFRHARHMGFLKSLPPRKTFMNLIRVSTPSSIQTIFFASGFTALYWIIGLIGTTDLAAANIMINVMLVAILPGVGLGFTAATFVGQALGSGDLSGAKQWGWDVAKVGFLLLLILGLPMFFFPEMIGRFFIDDDNTIRTLVPTMRLSGAFISIEGIYQVLTGALQGAGDTKRPMVYSVICQWCLYLPGAYYVGPILGFGLLEVWIGFGIYRLILTTIMMYLWSQGKWQETIV